jgi:hypothetical protein
MLLALAAFLTALTASLPAGATALRTFKNWMVGCDNTLSCRAIGTVAEDAGEPSYLVLDRAGGPEAAVSLRFMDQNGSAGRDGLFYSLDGAAPVAVAASAFAAPPKTDPDGAEPIALTGPAAVEVIDAVRNGKELRFGAKTPLQTDGQPVSLNGMAAALLFIDAVQGRLATVTALAVKGNKPAASVPAAPLPPLIPTVSPPKFDVAKAPRPRRR